MLVFVYRISKYSVQRVEKSAYSEEEKEKNSSEFRN